MPCEPWSALNWETEEQAGALPEGTGVTASVLKDPCTHRLNFQRDSEAQNNISVPRLGTHIDTLHTSAPCD